LQQSGGSNCIISSSNYCSIQDRLRSSNNSGNDAPSTPTVASPPGCSRAAADDEVAPPPTRIPQPSPTAVATTSTFDGNEDGATTTNRLRAKVKDLKAQLRML
jgi:hypothetical protein